MDATLQSAVASSRRQRAAFNRSVKQLSELEHCNDNNKAKPDHQLLSVMQITRYFTCPIWTTGEPKLWRTSHYSTTRSCCSRLAFNESSLTDIFQPKEYSNELPQCCVKPAPIAFCICGLCLVLASAIWLVSGGYNKLRARRHDTQPCVCTQTCRKTLTVVSEDIHITIKTHLDNLLRRIKLFGCAPSALLMFESL